MKFLAIVSPPSIYQVAISKIFLFETLYLDAAAQGEGSDPWTTDITALRRSLLVMVTRRWKRN